MAEFLVTTTAQVSRDYVVMAEDEAQAKRRMRSYITDPALADHVVTFRGQELTTPERIKAIAAGEGEAAPKDPETGE